MHKYLLSGLLLSVSIAFVKGQDSVTVNLLFIGDIMVHDTQLPPAYLNDSDTYDFSESFKFIQPEIENADLALANLECPLAGLPYTSFPTFSAPDNIAVSAQNAGIDVLFTANNHACDKWRAGIVRTNNVLDSLGILHTGTFHDAVNRDTVYPLVVEVKGIKLSLLNYTYGTNGIRIPKPAIVNLIDTAIIKADIVKAKLQNPDIIVAYLHWGDEYSQQPSAEQIKLTRFLFHQGVRLVIGSHPHVLQRMECVLQDSINQCVVYSMGNFVSGQRTAPRDGGAMVHVQLTKTPQKVCITDVKYELTYVHYPSIKGIRHFVVVPVWRAEADTSLHPMGSQGWGRLREYAKNARILLNVNKNVAEFYPDSLRYKP